MAPPEMHISPQSRRGAASVHGNTKLQTFAGGDVWIDPVLSSDGIGVANVNFAPGARTHWHWHEWGQLLRVIAGAGWVCDKGGKARRVGVGDVVWCPEGTVHWHGADEGSYMVHQAVSLGKVEWYEAVSEEEYAGKGAQ